MPASVHRKARPPRGQANWTRLALVAAPAELVRRDGGDAVHPLFPVKKSGGRLPLDRFRIILSLTRSTAQVTARAASRHVR